MQNCQKGNLLWVSSSPSHDLVCHTQTIHWIRTQVLLSPPHLPGQFQRKTTQQMILLIYSPWIFRWSILAWTPTLLHFLLLACTLINHPLSHSLSVFSSVSQWLLNLPLLHPHLPPPQAELSLMAVWSYSSTEVPSSASSSPSVVEVNWRPITHLMLGSVFRICGLQPRWCWAHHASMLKVVNWFKEEDPNDLIVIIRRDSGDDSNSDLDS